MQVFVFKKRRYTQSTSTGTILYNILLIKITHERAWSKIITVYNDIINNVFPYIQSRLIIRSKWSGDDGLRSAHTHTHTTYHTIWIRRFIRMWQPSCWLRGINQGVGLERRRSSLNPTKIGPLIIKIKDAMKRQNISMPIMV